MTHIDMKKPEDVDIAWRVISFFASDAETQIANVGELNYVFFEKNQRLSRRANYLIALHYLFVVYKNSFWDYYDLPEDSEIQELRELFNILYWNRDPDIWQVSRLRDEQLWQDVRTCACGVLEQAKITAAIDFGAFDFSYVIQEFALDTFSSTVRRTCIMVIIEMEILRAYEANS